LKVYVIFLTFFLFLKVGYSQDRKSLELNLECIAFYNLENLFDTIVDPDTNKILQEDPLMIREQERGRGYDPRPASFVNAVRFLRKESAARAPGSVTRAHPRPQRL
jgi:hypothetical protein